MKRQTIAQRATVIALVVNLMLSCLKLGAALLGRSSALLADALHSISDVATDLVVLVSLRLSRKPADEDHPYGHGKIETLAAVVVGGVLAYVAIRILYSGVVDIHAAAGGASIARPTYLALGAAVASLIVKELLFRYTRAVGRRLQSPALIANAWHQRSDALSSVGTTLGIAGAMFLGTPWRILDPIAAVVISLILAKVAYDILRANLHDLLDGAPDSERSRLVVETVDQIQGADRPHCVRVRRLGSSYAVDLHVEVAPQLTVDHAHDITASIRDALRSVLGSETIVTVHVDPSR